MKENKNIVDREVLEVIRDSYAAIFPAEKKVADLILRKPQEVVNYKVSELARASEVSDATIVRMCHHLGYSGYYQFRIALARDLGKKQFKVTGIEGSDDIVRKTFEDFAETVLEIGKSFDKETLRSCIDLIKNAGTVHIISVGNTTNLARYMGFRLERLGIKSTYSELPEYYINHINLSDERDIAIAISKSGTSKRVLEAMRLAKEKNLKMIAITANIQSPAAELADYVLPSSAKQEPLSVYKGYSYLNEFVIIDALLSFTVNEELIEVTQANRPELLLAGDKL
ncbi:MAG: MurR/RpiR family transcriptional regulator [Lachnospiraceae bacterium]|nr:MurR/RpiR family transcriptional regulator [Lachnospiraceae bacterium]